MKNNSLSLLVLALIFFVACGDDEGSVGSNNLMALDVVDEVSDLPKCTKDNEGEQAFVKGEMSSRICVDGKWFATKDTVVVKKNSSCTTKELKDKSGVKILCDGDSVGVVLNGKDGSDGKDGKNGKNGTDGADGDGCSVETLSDNSGLKVLCGRDSVGVVLNGKQGEKGDKGDSGTDGKNGSSCSLDQQGSVVTIKCGDKSTVIDLGMDSDIGGGNTEPVVLDSEMIAVSLDEVSGVTQKGPFLMGSKVLIHELSNGRSLKQTGNSFNGKIVNDNGQFKINAQTLVSQYILLSASGYYKNEITGENSKSELTLFALTDVSNRNTVNVNLLTHLEYDRVVYLVTEKKMKVGEAKKQAQKEILAILDIDATDFSNSEDLNIAGASNEDGALLALSVLFQGDRSESQLTELLSKIAADMEENGVWNDASTKMSIAEWAADADSSGKLDVIRSNVEKWGLSSMVPNFEKHVRHFWNVEYGLGDCTEKRVGEVVAATAGKRKGSKTRFICKEISELTGDFRWVVANDIEKDTYGWKDGTDGALKAGSITGKKYVFDKLGSFNGTVGWRIAESIEQQYGGCIEALYDSIRTDKVYAYYYTCKKETHTWVREVNYLIIDTQYWPDSTDGKIKWGDSMGVATPGTRICYVWDEAEQYNGWRTGNATDCNLGLLGCTAKRSGEMRKAINGRYYSCSNNSWTEITDDIYINTYLYRCTINDEGDKVFKEGDLVYGIEKTKTRYACENEKWRDTKIGEEQVGKACTAKLEGLILGDTITCDANNWRQTIFFDYPVDKDWTNPDLTYGSLKDDRDGRVYKTIKINGMTVMAENLNYADSLKNPYLKENNWCYNNDSINCLKGGRYYTWTAAMDIDKKWLTAIVPDGTIQNLHQGVCPQGWHIPTYEEWHMLYENNDSYDMMAVGNRLWKKATNASGFSVLPTGYGPGVHTDCSADFWVSSGYLGERGAEYGNVSDVYNANCWETLNQHSKGLGFSVRCIKDEEE